MAIKGITLEQAQRDLAENIGFCVALGNPRINLLFQQGTYIHALAQAYQGGAEYTKATGLVLTQPPEECIDLADKLRNEGIRPFPRAGEVRREAVARGEDGDAAVEQARAEYWAELDNPLPPYAEDPAEDGIEPQPLGFAAQD